MIRCLTRGQRGLVLWTARIALVVISFQLAALDHHVNLADVTGIEGSSEHVMHCHGGTSGCSDAGAGVVATATDAYLLPRPALLLAEQAAQPGKPRQVFATLDPEPPRL